MVTVVNLVKQTCFFSMLLPVGVVLCMPGQYRAFQTLAVIIAAGRRGMLATVVKFGLDITRIPLRTDGRWKAYL